MPTPSHRFIIHSDKRRFSVEVRVFQTLKHMIAAGPLEKNKNALAYTCGHREHMPPGIHAIVYFHQKDISPQTVAHEMVHAALCVLARKGVKSIPVTLDDAPSTEERLASITDFLVEGFNKGIKRYQS